MTPEQEHEQLAAGAAELGLQLDAQQRTRLLRLLDALQAGNAQFNLTAIRARPDMLVKHVLDSLSVLPFLVGATVADVGTGAGFPGLPLAIAAPERRFTLIDSTGKKARFVAQTAESLDCRNVTVVHERAEKYRPAAAFDTVVARALASLADLVGYAGHLCAPGGRLLAMKGKRPTEELAALPKTFRVLAVHRLNLPGLKDERHLIEIVRALPAPRTAASAA